MAIGEMRNERTIVSNEHDAARSNSDESTRSGPAQIRVILSDDHNIVREGLRLLLEAAEDIKVVGEA